MNKYTAKYFSDNLPDWKRKKDPILVRLFYRPLSFYCSAFFANGGFSANDVTVISIVITFLADGLIAASCINHALGIIGTILVSVWLLLDCTDGNMARSIKKQPYGEFLDALGSYVLVAFFGLVTGICVFARGGVILQRQDFLPLIIGALSSITDLLMRVTHQKFIVTGMNYNYAKSNSKFTESDNLLAKVKERAQLELGIGGILPPIIVLCMFFDAMDLILIYVFLYNGLSCLAIVTLYIVKAMKYRKETID